MRYHATNKGLVPYTDVENTAAGERESAFIQEEADRLIEEADSVSLVEAVQAILDDKNGNPGPLNDVKTKRVR